MTVFFLCNCVTCVTNSCLLKGLKGLIVVKLEHCFQIYIISLEELNNFAMSMLFGVMSPLLNTGWMNLTKANFSFPTLRFYSTIVPTMYLWQLCPTATDCFHQSSTFLTPSSQCLWNTTWPKWKVRASSRMTEESITWRMDNNTKAKGFEMDRSGVPPFHLS